MEDQFLYKAWANQEILDEVEKIDLKEYPEKWTMAVRLLNHTHVVDNIFIAHINSRPHSYKSTNTPETPSIDRLRSSVSKTDLWLVEYSKKISKPELAKTVKFTFTDGDMGEMTIENVLNHLVIHGAYHRGNVGMLLSDCGIQRPSDIFTRYLNNYAQPVLPKT